MEIVTDENGKFLPLAHWAVVVVAWQAAEKRGLT
jgi:hypothetical protein